MFIKFTIDLGPIEPKEIQMLLQNGGTTGDDS